MDIVSSKISAVTKRSKKIYNFICGCGVHFQKRGIPRGEARCETCLEKDKRRRHKLQYDLHKILPEEQEYNHTFLLKRKYGITKDFYNQLLANQNGVCVICKKTDKNKRLAVDHDHKTGEIRGLLCSLCNTSLGRCKDDVSLVRNYLSYLSKSSPRRSWDEYFLDIAELVATRSKDPSTKVGAVIVRNRVILSTGYNGFPKGVNDNILSRYSRPEKYIWTVHAEENAILNACVTGTKIDGATLYVTPLSPCSKCAITICQSGIKEVVYKKAVENPRFEESCLKAEEIFDSCKVLLRRPE